jgi:hypothetical protein
MPLLRRKPKKQLRQLGKPFESRVDLVREEVMHVHEVTAFLLDRYVHE